MVGDGARREGVATTLMNAAFEWLESRGMPRVVLGTAASNEPAQRLFDRLGFRRTMIEMTREL
jgi:ribosomal protein S18 acetylase RimI-like enzyme